MVQMTPLDYSGVVNSSQNIASRAMEAYEQTKTQLTAQRAAEAEAQAIANAEERTKLMQERAAEIAMKDNYTAEDINNLMLEFPEYSKHYEALYGNVSAEEKKNLGLQATTLANAINSGQTEFAKQYMTEIRDAAEDKGETTIAKQMDQMLQQLEIGGIANRALAQSSDMFANWALGAEEYADVKATLGEEGRNVEIADIKARKLAAEAGLMEAQTLELLNTINNFGGADLTDAQREVAAYLQFKADGNFEAATALGRRVGIEALPTNEDDYVESMTKAWLANPDNAGKTTVPGGLEAEWRKEHKRAQADEQYANELAINQAKIETAEKLAYNTANGKLMAEIARAAEMRIAKGELSEVETMENAKQSMEKLIGEIAEKYFDLNAMDAILNTEDNTLESITKATRTSKLGQTFGRITGSEPQAIRDVINAKQAAILNEIKQAKNISARGLDSEKELEFYSRILTDPSKNIQTNIALVAVLSDTYGDSSTANALRNMIKDSPELVKLVADLTQEHEDMYANATDLSDEVIAARQELGLSTPENPEDLTQTPAEIPTITTQAQIDQLPSGAYFYVIQNGKKVKARKD